MPAPNIPDWAAKLAALKSRPRLLLGGAIVVAVLLLVAGSGDAQIGGVYSNPARNYGFHFRPDGVATFAGGGPSMRYWVSGKTIYVELPDGLQTIHVMDEDTLRVAAKQPREILRDRSYVCSDANGEIGTLLLQNTGHVFLSAPAGSPHAKEGAQAMGSYRDSGSEISIKGAGFDQVFSYRGTSDLKADTVTCKRSST